MNFKTIYIESISLPTQKSCEANLTKHLLVGGTKSIVELLSHMFELPVTRASPRRAFPVELLHEKYVGYHATVQLVKVRIVHVGIPEVVSEY